MKQLEFMYTSNRLEWHPGDETVGQNPSDFCGGSCQATNEAFAAVSIVLLSLLPRAKIHQRNLRGFSFGQTVLHTIVRPQPGGVEEKGYTVCHWLGGSSRIIRATGRIVKSGAHRRCGGMTIPSGGETFVPSYLMSGVGGSLGEKSTQ